MPTFSLFLESVTMKHQNTLNETTSLWPKGLNYNWARDMGSSLKSKPKKGVFKGRKVTATPEHVVVEFDFSYIAGDEKGLFMDNAFATVAGYVDSYRKDYGFEWGHTHKDPKSLNFHGVNKDIKIGPDGKKPNTLPSNQLMMDVKITPGGKAPETWNDIDQGQMFTARMEFQLS